MTPSPVTVLTVVRYPREPGPWSDRHVRQPAWQDVERAIRRMDDHCWPIVSLGCRDVADAFEDEDSFHVLGGLGRLALFHMPGDWRYCDPAGGREEVRLWTSDQGYWCEERNICRDVELALRIVATFYRTGSYDGLDAVR